MSYKNYKKDYDLYTALHFHDVREMLERSAEKYGTRCAISYRKKPTDKEAVRVGYDEVLAGVAALATALIRRGLRGKRIAIIGENSLEWMYSYYAVTSMGAVAVPIDKDYPADDMISVLNSAACSALLFSPSIKERYSRIKESVPTLEYSVAFRPSDDCEGALLFDGLIEEGKGAIDGGDRSYYEYEIDREAMVSIVFTSGTTGKGKGVMLSTANILDDLENGMYLFLMPNKTIFTLPPHHTFASSIITVGHYMQGFEIYISSGTRYLMNEMKQENPTHLILVPLYIETFYKRIFGEIEKQGKLRKVRFMMRVSNLLRRLGIDLRERIFKDILKNFGDSMRLIVSGGAALGENIINDLDAVGITILNGYGITECSPLISANRNNYRKPGSVGRPIIDEQVKIAHPNDDGEGEICIKGTNVMMGYYGDSEATEAAFDGEGYFRTGDIGKVDDEGWIYITGRSKNLIVLSNGKNVYPEELETELSEIYGVSEAVVYEGRKRSGKSGDVIVAEIFPDKEALSLRGITDIKQYFDSAVAKLNSEIAHYKRIGAVKLRDVEFEKNTTRKILRAKIDRFID